MKKIKIYMADEIWAGREFNPAEIPMGMEFVAKSDYNKIEAELRDFNVNGSVDLLRRYRTLTAELKSRIKDAPREIRSAIAHSKSDSKKYTWEVAIVELKKEEL